MSLQSNWKPELRQRSNSQKIWPYWVLILSLWYGHVLLVSGYVVLRVVDQQSFMDVQHINQGCMSLEPTGWCIASILHNSVTIVMYTCPPAIMLAMTLFGFFKLLWFWVKLIYYFSIPATLILWSVIGGILGTSPSKPTQVTLCVIILTL